MILKDMIIKIYCSTSEERYLYTQSTMSLVAYPNTWIKSLVVTINCKIQFWSTFLKEKKMKKGKINFVYIFLYPWCLTSYKFSDISSMTINSSNYDDQLFQLSSRQIDGRATPFPLTRKSFYTASLVHLILSLNSTSI